MKQNENILLHKLLVGAGGGHRRLWAGLALFLGAFFLLLAVAMWWNFRIALEGKDGSDALGSGYLTVSKTISDEDMALGGKVKFSESDIAALRAVPGVEEVGRLTGAAFPVSASMGGRGGLSTLLFLESVPDRMLDTLPEDWQWTPSRQDVPIILAKEFLRTYNYVFAPTQGLPQLSENAVKAIGFDLTLGAGPDVRPFRGQIVGFSDRITSVLAPQAFMDYMHKAFRMEPPPPVRLLVRAKDPSDPVLVQWLRENRYEVGGESQRLSTLRRVVDGISAGTGLLSLILLATGLTLFLLIIRLLLSEARDSLKLLLELGYSPSQLGRFVTKLFLPQAVLSLLAALVLATGINAVVSHALEAWSVYWPSNPGWMLLSVWALVVGTVVWQIKSNIRRLIR